MKSIPAGRPSRRLVLAGVVLAALYAAWAVPFMLESSVVAIDGHRYYGLFDDAMISLRYAWNFSHGQGLVWNPGEHVEGYTNLLWTLILSIFTGIFSKPIAALAVQILGIVIVLGCAFMAWRLSQRVTAERPDGERLAIGMAVVALTLTYYPLSHWTLTGMETGLLTLLLLAALVAVEAYAHSRSRASLVVVGILLGLAYLTREDSAIFAAPIFIYMATLPRDGRGDVPPTRAVLPALGLFLLFAAGREAFRLTYYGNFLPNTYFLKLTGMPLLDRLRDGLSFSSLYLATHLIFLGICIWGTSLAPERRKVLYLNLAMMPILYQIYVGGDPVRMWRVITPSQPATAVLFALAAVELLRRARLSLSAPRGRRSFGYLTALAILTVNLIFTPYILFREQWFPLDFYTVRINAAVAVNEVTTDDASVSVLAAGVIPYYTDRHAYDMLGKSDPYIARLPADLSGAVGWGGMRSVPGHNKYDLEYSVEKLLPTYAETSTWGRQDITAWMEQHYARATYKGVELWLLKGSPDVRWELMQP